MKCPYCNAEISDDAKFCESCGKKITKENQINNISNKIDIKKLCIAAGVILLVIVGIIYFVTRPKKVELINYVNEPTVAGINGGGYIDTLDLFNESLFYEDIVSSRLPDSNYDNMNDESSLEQLSKDIQLLEEIENEYSLIRSGIYFSYYINGTSAEDLCGIKNGDKVKIEIHTTYQSSKYFNKSFKDGNLEIEVNGLVEGEMIDPFSDEYMIINYQGTDGDAIVVVTNNLPYDIKSSIKYSTYPSEGLSNGMTYTIYANFDPKELSEKGYGLSNTKTEKTVSGLPEFVYTADQIDKTILSDLIDDCIDYIDSDFFRQDPEYVTTYFGTHSNDATYHNELFIILKFYMSNGLNGEMDEYYTVASLTDLKIDADNNLSSGYFNDLLTPYINFFSNSYESLDETKEKMNNNNFADIEEIVVDYSK